MGGLFLSVYEAPHTTKASPHSTRTSIAQAPLEHSATTIKKQARFKILSPKPKKH